MNVNPRPNLCIGIASTNETYEVVALKQGEPAAVMQFPSGRNGVEAIKRFLAGCSNPVRLAIAGVTAVGLAMALGDAPRRETYIVSPSVADRAAALAHYAEHCV